MTRAELKDSTPTSPADQRLFAGRYRTHARIGTGRLGEIFAATDEGYEQPGDKQRLAIQIVPENIVRNNRLFNQFNLGYSQLRACAHPNIVEYLQFGRHGKLGFLVMEHLDGASLRFVLDDAEWLPLDEAKPIILGIGEALRLLHAKDMVHGNLTTKNVFITETLEVRLLDVLPVDPAGSIVGGAAMGDSFSRCTTEDDVFGLACLAYEMLAGKHPFNFCRLAEARLAGLEADRIDSLTDSEWNALRHALSFDREQRTTSVADFIQDFGILGSERLRPALEEIPQMTSQAAPTHGTAATAPVVAFESVATDEYRPTPARPARKRGRPMRAVFLGMLLAGLIAWSYYGQPQEHFASLLSYIDESVDRQLTSQGDGSVEIPIVQSDGPVEIPIVQSDESVEMPIVDTVESVSTGTVAAVDYPAAIAPAASDEGTLANSEAKRNEEERAADSDAEPTQMEPEVRFAESVVSVSEGAGAARITLVRTEDSTMPLIWWTREHSASADTDFISVGQKAVLDLSTEDGNVLHIPLVNDSIPEPRESFFVSLGHRDSEQGKIERLATVRVDIIDDD